MLDEHVHQGIRSAILHLDAMLTGRQGTAVHNMSQKSDDDLLEWADGGVEYYLSDGGYSRIVASCEEPKIWLTSNSRRDVKEAWIRPDVEEARLELIRALSRLKDRPRQVNVRPDNQARRGYKGD